MVNNIAVNVLGGGTELPGMICKNVMNISAPCVIFVFQVIYVSGGFSKLY